MKSQFTKAREFIRGAARLNDLLYVISKGKAPMAKGIAHTSLIAVDQGQWADGVDTDWDSTAIAVARLPTEKVVVVGDDGDVVTFVGGKSVSEELKPTPVVIRNAREIGGYVYACGMKRQVYKRTGEKRWIDMSAPPVGPTEKFGFEAIDGYSEDEIYAVGWGGEIWQYNGSKWANCKSPTNVILSAVCCAPDKTLYIAGQKGVLV